MKRTIESGLSEWCTQTHHKPLLIRGARQIGKTYTITQFGREKFSNVVAINLEVDTALSSAFSTLNPIDIINKIQILTGQSIVPGKTLLFIDEIQLCPQAIAALRYFHEEMPGLHVIGAGSLLELTLNAAGISMPVGRIQYLYMKPMSFEEFMLAMGQEASIDAFATDPALFSNPEIHQKMLGWVKQYLLIGGMPEVVREYRDSGNYERCRRIQTALLQTYQDDFNKYARYTQQAHIGKVFQSAVKQIGSKFKYSKIDPDTLSRDIKQALEWLVMAGVYHKVVRTSADGLPLAANANERYFKVLFLDVGLMQNLCGLASEIIQQKDLMRIYQGALMEQLVGQELIAHQDFYTKPALYYWAREAKNSNAELDYVCQHEAAVVPIEVKAGKTGRLKSLHLFLAEKRQVWGIKIASSPLSAESPVLSLPFYLIRHWPVLWNTYTST